MVAYKYVDTFHMSDDSGRSLIINLPVDSAATTMHFCKLCQELGFMLEVRIKNGGSGIASVRKQSC